MISLSTMIPHYTLLCAVRMPLQTWNTIMHVKCSQSETRQAALDQGLTARDHESNTA
jgi:hypothetical protein